MNVLFHSTLGIATVAITAHFFPLSEDKEIFRKSDVPVLLFLFGINIVIHGVLDIAPHTYPLSSIYDVILSLCFMPLVFTFVNRQCWVLLLAAYIGSVFPDIIDIGIPKAMKTIGIDWNIPRLFPWHFKEFSGSIYTDTFSLPSLVSHLFVLSAELFIFIKFRHAIRKNILSNWHY